jgi:oxygen-dependent protoporphyrinogen oxidase
VKKVAIIGGGISGLAAAFALEKARQSGAALEYQVFEASSRFGGVLRTENVEGCVLEAGPDSFLTEKSWAGDFCRELGLGDQLIASNDAERKTYIYVKGRLVPLPDGLAFMVPTKIWPIVSSPLFSLNTKLKMAKEWFSSRREEKEDESVSDFIERHYGTEMVDRLADPLLSGVYGGSAAQLSIQSVLPRFAEMEAKFGSLGKGMLAARKTAPAKPPQPVFTSLSVFTSLKNGMQQMTDTLTARIPASSLRANTKIDSIALRDRQWTVYTRAASERFDAIVLAAPASIAGSILQGCSQELAATLQQIPYSSSMTVAMGFPRDDLKSLPSGFGFLVPRSQNKKIMATTFVHQKFPFRGTNDLGLIRCFLGGSQDEQILQADDQEITKIVREELKQILGLNAAPKFTRVFLWRKAMAQYTVGHKKRTERIQQLTAELPQFALAGNAYSGIGIPDCIRSGQKAALQILGALGLQESTKQTENS